MKPSYYIAYMADSKCNPIENTEKVYSGKSCRAIIKHIAYENGIKAPWYASNILRLENGNAWCVEPVFNLEKLDKIR